MFSLPMKSKAGHQLSGNFCHYLSFTRGQFIKTYFCNQKCYKLHTLYFITSFLPLKVLTDRPSFCIQLVWDKNDNRRWSNINLTWFLQIPVSYSHHDCSKYQSNKRVPVDERWLLKVPFCDNINLPFLWMLSITFKFFTVHFLHIDVVVSREVCYALQLSPDWLR